MKLPLWTLSAGRDDDRAVGNTPPIGRLLVTDWAPNHEEGDKLLFIFDGGILSGTDRESIRLAPGELTAYAFHEVARAHELTISRLARRVTHGHAAHHDGTTRYLEHGQPVS
jgi:8-oxo-dGTP diphosphatase